MAERKPQSINYNKFPPFDLALERYYQYKSYWPNLAKLQIDLVNSMFNQGLDPVKALMEIRTINKLFAKYNPDTRNN